MDAVAANRSVLVATRSRAAADAVAELLTRTPGPDPIRFGDGHAIRDLIDELDHRRLTPMSGEAVTSLEHALRSAEHQEAAIRRSVELALQTELQAERAEHLDAAIPALIEEYPRLFDPRTDLDEVADRIASAHAAEGGQWPGWWRNWRRRRNLTRAHRLAGSSTGASGAESLVEALDVARSRRAAAVLSSTGGTSLSQAFEALLETGEHRRRATGDRLGAIQSDPERHRRGGAAAITGLLAALRTGRSKRRELLIQLPARDLTAVTPLWVGTLSEIEDVLPPTAEMFDLVFLDEASQIDQAVGRYAGEDSRSLLDVRRVSAFDLAAATGTAVRLRQHFRSNPHLIEFPLKRFYGEEVSIMTTTPATESADCIEVHRIDTDESTEPLESEAAAVVTLVEAMISKGASDIGVISPFRRRPSGRVHPRGPGCTHRTTRDAVSARLERAGRLPLKVRPRGGPGGHPVDRGGRSPLSRAVLWRWRRSDMAPCATATAPTSDRRAYPVLCFVASRRDSPDSPGWASTQAHTCSGNVRARSRSAHPMALRMKKSVWSMRASQ